MNANQRIPSHRTREAGAPRSGSPWTQAAAVCVLVACGSTGSEAPEPPESADPSVRPSRIEAEEPSSIPASSEPATQPAGGAEPGDGLTWQRATSRGGKYTLEWRAIGDTVPVNEHFEVRLRLYRGDDTSEPVRGVRIHIAGWMPDHGHGMLRRPTARELGDGEYHFEGVLFHMGGFWQLFFDVLEDGLSERTQFELEL